MRKLKFHERKLLKKVDFLQARALRSRRCARRCARAARGGADRGHAGTLAWRPRAPGRRRRALKRAMLGG
jgi:hypothetical protein